MFAAVVVAFAAAVDVAPVGECAFGCASDDEEALVLALALVETSVFEEAAEADAMDRQTAST